MLSKRKFAAGSLVRLPRTTRPPIRFRRRRYRRKGTASLEGAMLAAVMVPLAGLLFFLMIRVCQLLHELVAASMIWPYL